MQFRHAESAYIKQAHQWLEWPNLSDNGGPVTTVKYDIGHEEIDALQQLLTRSKHAGFIGAFDDVGSGFLKKYM